MEIKMRDDLDVRSKSLKHSIITQAVILLDGREGALKSEKEIYAIIAFMDKIAEGGIIDRCNEDSRALMDIYNEDIEPAFLDLIKTYENYDVLFQEIVKQVYEYCDKVYAEQHSMYGLLNLIIDMIGSLEPEQIQDTLVKTGEMAANIKKQHNDKIAQQEKEYQTKVIDKQSEINESLTKLMEKYNVTAE